MHSEALHFEHNAVSCRQRCP